MSDAKPYTSEGMREMEDDPREWLKWQEESGWLEQRLLATVRALEAAEAQLAKERVAHHEAAKREWKAKADFVDMLARAEKAEVDLAALQSSATENIRQRDEWNVELLGVLRLALETLEHGQENAKWLTGGDERRFARAIEAIRKELEQ